jgi:cytochrome c oxidase assembly factor CtaG
MFLIPLLGILFWMFMVVLLLAAFAFWIWMIISVTQNRGLNDSDRIVWILVVIFLHVLGAFIYFLLGHPKRHTPLT